MRALISVSIPIIVEGKYDKIKLSSFIDGVILTTDGFGIFKDKQKREFIRKVATDKGIIVATDSDSAGAVIRSHIKNICPNGKIINVYIPQIKGKEKRKDKASAEGLLGLEGIDIDLLENAFLNSGVGVERVEKEQAKITKKDLFCYGLSGGENSAVLRKDFAQFLYLPTNLSSNAFLDALNTVLTYNEFLEAVEKWQHETDKK